MKKKYSFTFLILTLVYIFSVSSSLTAGTKVKVALGGQQPTSIDPTSFASGEVISGLVFDSLVEFLPNGKMSPMLATSWSYSKDGKEITFKLRKGVKFSNGLPFTAKDVVFSTIRSKKNNMAIEDQLRTGFKEVKAIDDYTVKFVFTAPNAQFVYQTGGGLLIVSEADFNKAGEKAYTQNPIGTGAYKFAGWKAGQYIDVAANEYYWREKPQVTEARIYLVPDDSTRVNMLKAKEVDLITQAPWQNVSELKQAGYSITKVVGPHAQAFSFGMVNPNTPWANLKVRQAINYCIDKDAIINTIFNGVPEKLQWQHSSELGYDPSMRPAYPYNPEKAKKLMKEAGYEKGFEMPVVVLTDQVGAKNVIDYIASSLKQIGITVKVIPMKFGPEYFAKEREWHDDPNAMINTYEEIGGPMNPDPIINLTNSFYGGKPRGIYHKPELDKIIDKALVTVNEKERIKLIKQAYKIIDADLPMIHVLQTVYIFAGQKNVKFTPKSSFTIAFFSLLRGLELK